MRMSWKLWFFLVELQLNLVLGADCFRGVVAGRSGSAVERVSGAFVAAVCCDYRDDFLIWVFLSLGTLHLSVFFCEVEFTSNRKE
ncbi:hypothetical protein KC19_1G037200 [Ceratodon purpureus]|uniref:Secreted protein n=1 Tax=Ceratodon purpureus TaxID=3225 RepID=A0A8T0J288_CERPU|nr:hypothetical protein KC19_1G037200 [Ceratodon purpureus]